MNEYCDRATVQSNVVHEQPNLNLNPQQNPVQPVLNHVPYLFNLSAIKQTYKERHSTWVREAFKWVFSIATLGLGALYLWATTVIIREGEIGMRRNARGEMVLLPPGRHSNFPWEEYVSVKKVFENPRPGLSNAESESRTIPLLPEQASPCKSVPISQNFIQLGPYTIFTVRTGCVAKTYLRGELMVFPAGQYLLTDAAHVVNQEDAYISIQEETKALKPVSALTNNNVALKIQADVRYKIENPHLAVTKVDDIENTIFEIAKFNIAQVVNHHDLSEFVPVTVEHEEENEEENEEGELSSRQSDASSIEEEDVNLVADNKGLSKVLIELKRKITSQLQGMGIKLLNIGITSWSIQDERLAHELAQGAVIQSQTISKKLAAEQDKQVKEIEAEGDANAMRIRAIGEADAIKTKGAAFLEVANTMANNPVAAKLFQTHQQTAWFSSSSHILFNMNQEGGANQGTVPLVINTPTQNI